MKFKNSIIYPILGVLTLLISIAAIFHYFAQVTLLQETVKSKEELRSKDIRFAIQTLIDKETDKLSALAKALKEQDELVWEVAYYPNSEDNVSYLKEVMDRVYLGLNVEVFFVNRVTQGLHRGGLPIDLLFQVPVVSVVVWVVTAQTAKFIYEGPTWRG